MKCGIPVLTSTIGSAPEVAGGHAVLVNSYDIDDIQRGMEKVITTKAEQIEKAREYSQKFTWYQTARKTLRAYQSTVNTGSSLSY